MSEKQFDVILVGGGLANGLIAFRLLKHRPEWRVLIIEQADKLGGEHTWSFHSSDLSPEQLAWFRPLITRSWPSYRAIFPKYTRTMSGGYHSVTSAHFHQTLFACLGERVVLGRKVSSLSPNEVRLEDGTRYQSHCVIDGRGFRHRPEMKAGYQKFLGLDVTLAEPHGEIDPILMDGRAVQREGLRFFYTLPWSDRRIQIGEARYTESPHVDREEFRAAVLEYAEKQGWKINQIEREEIGVLPAPLEVGKTAGGKPSFEDELIPGVPVVGVRAGLFHATTGYSLPYALRFAEKISELPSITSPAVLALASQESADEWKRGRYFRLLNRMMFRAADPQERLPMFQQFYRRPEGLIQRFYLGRLKVSDYLRIMTGKPPVSLKRAMHVFLGWA